MAVSQRSASVQRDGETSELDEFLRLMTRSSTADGALVIASPGNIWIGLAANSYR